jgi:hypothetical protein
MQKPYVSRVNGRFSLLRLAHDDPSVGAADERAAVPRGWAGSCIYVVTHAFLSIVVIPINGDPDTVWYQKYHIDAECQYEIFAPY